MKLYYTVDDPSRQFTSGLLYAGDNLIQAIKLAASCRPHWYPRISVWLEGRHIGELSLYDFVGEGIRVKELFCNAPE